MLFLLLISQPMSFQTHKTCIPLRNTNEYLFDETLSAFYPSIDSYSSSFWVYYPCKRHNRAVLNILIVQATKHL